MLKRGIALGSAGKHREAVAAFQVATELNPNSAQAQHNLGVALIQAGELAEGAKAIDRAIALQPAYPEAHFNLGNALASMGKRQDSIDQYVKAIALRPDYPEVLNNLGLRLTDAGRPEEAIPHLERAVDLRPQFTDALSNLGIALEAMGRFDEAEAKLKEALRQDPDSANGHTNLANVLKARGQLPEALAEYNVALQLDPDSASTRYNRSLALLQSGDFANGWKEYECRLRRPHGHSRCPTDKPRWDGSPGEGRVILVWAEQGLGDVVQFIRFAPLLKEKGFRVYVHVPGILLRLLNSLKGVDWLVPEGTAIPTHDLQCPLMSLPYHLGTTLETIPATVPYLAPIPALVERWGKVLNPLPSRKVGLYWQGNPHHPGDRHRSLPLAELAPLASIPDVQLVSLQQGPGREQVGAKGKEFGVIDLGDEFQTPDDLAAAVSLMDVVVTVDTACAHVTGALGKPVWLLLAVSPDWRWQLGREDSPWYPTARLFRQSSVGNWPELIRNVISALACAQP